MGTGLDYLLSSGAKVPTGLDYLMGNAKAPLDPRANPVASKPDPGMAAVIGNGLVKGASGFGDMIGNVLVNAANLGIVGYGLGKKFVTGSNDLPDLIPSDALGGYSKLAAAANLTSPDREPATGAQRVADFAAQVVGGGGINPRAITRAALNGKIVNPLVQLATPVLGGAAGGLASEVTRQIDPDTWYGRTAQAVVPVVAQLGASYPLAHMSPAGVRASQTTKNITADQWSQAADLARRAAAMGAPISATEALQAVVGNSPGLQSLQRVTEQSRPGVNTLAPAFAQRPEQNAALLARVADGISPTEADPSAIAGTMQNAANGALQTARNFGNTEAAPFYAASSNDPSVTVPSATWASLAADPAVNWALQQTKNNPLLGVQGAQAGSLQWLDAAKKFLDSHASSQSQAGNNFPAAQASRAATAITSAVDPVVPLYAAARNIVANNMANNVEPMTAGQVGQLSRSPAFATQASTLLPENPMDVTPGTVAQTAQTIGAEDPAIGQRWLAQYLRGTFNNANQDLQGGANQGGGAKFAAKVAGNDMQAQNLQALTTGVGADPTGLQNALDVWRAQGTRPAVGSATTFNNGETGLLSGGLLSAIGKPLQIPGLLAEKAAYATSTRDLANALTPDAGTVGRFQDLAQANGSYDPMMQAIASSLLTSANQEHAKNIAYQNYISAYDAAPDDATKIALGQQYAATLAGLQAPAAAAQQ